MGFGDRGAQIIADEGVTEILKRAIEAELANRGFNLGKDSVLIAVELRTFRNDFREGSWSGCAEAHVMMNALVKEPGGTVVFSKLVRGKGDSPCILVASVEDAQIALNAALQNAVSQLFAYNTFENAINGVKAIAQTNAIAPPQFSNGTAPSNTSTRVEQQAAPTRIHERRIALVVGNSNYEYVPHLRNPSNDARLMAATLQTLGFTLVGGRAQLGAPSK